MLIVRWLLRPRKRRRRSHFGDRRPLGESVRITLQRGDIGNGEVVHHLESHARFFLEGGTRTAHGQHKQIDGPEDRDGPEHCVANGVALAEDASVAVDVVTGDCDYARIDGDDGVGLNHHAVETEFHPTLANKVAWIFVIFKTADEVAVDWKNGAPVALRVAELAEDGVADRGSFG